MKEANYQGLTEDLRRILVETEAMLKSAAAEADGALDTGRKRTWESLRRAQEHLRAAENELVDRAHSVDRQVRAHPWQAIAATGAVAFLLGLSLALRRRN